MGTALLSALVLLGAGNSCAFPLGGAAPIIVRSRTIVLQWDPPAANVPSGPLAVAWYYVYFRQHGGSHWYFCGQVAPSENPQIVLQHSDFGDGRYDFAVSAVSGMGGESPLHTCSDFLASPVGGWYVAWLLSG